MKSILCNEINVIQYYAGGVGFLKFIHLPCQFEVYQNNHHQLATIHLPSLSFVIMFHLSLLCQYTPIVSHRIFTASFVHFPNLFFFLSSSFLQIQAPSSMHSTLKFNFMLLFWLLILRSILLQSSLHSFIPLLSATLSKAS